MPVPGTENRPVVVVVSQNVISGVEQVMVICLEFCRFLLDVGSARLGGGTSRAA